ncbi:MAG TPA: metalloregulator ArsR/SmtB family transcription factor [Thermoanaerobaculia bacterium]|nr:metalloregulator ArsR/SmtB family transcription factor [Thermoanaerobaculia bacterium]
MRPSDDLLARIADRLKALADPMRLRILHELEDGEVCVGDLAARVGGSAANVSKHLAVLRGAGLVRCRRDGMNVCYCVVDPAAFEVCRLVRDSLAQAAERATAELKQPVELRGAPSGPTTRRTEQDFNLRSG